MAKTYIIPNQLNPGAFVDYSKVEGTIQNIANFKKYNTNPELVRQQLINESQYIIQSRGLSAVKTLSYIIDRKTYAEGEDLRRQQQDGKSRFGTPIFDMIQFSGEGKGDALNYTERTWDINKKEFVETSVEQDPTNLTTALINITNQKNIIVTDVQGRPGPVYEYISKGAYKINIKGVLVSPYRDVYPEDAVKALVDYLEAPTSIQVVSYTLNKIYRIFDVVVMDYNFYSDEAKRNVVHFDINLQDEVPFQVQNTK